MTETLVPKGAAFQDWQANQLQALAQALAQATGKPASSLTVAAERAAGAVTDPSPAADASSGSASALAASPPPAQAGAANPLAHTGSGDRMLILIAAMALLLGGLGVIGGAVRRRGAPLWRCEEGPGAGR